MKNKVEKELHDYLSTLDIIDAHEHLISEERHYNKYLSYWDYFNAYLKWDLYSAGASLEHMDKQITNVEDENALFNHIKPYLGFVEHSSYYNSIRYALKKYHHVDTIDETNYLQISKQLRDTNKQGLYQEIFDDNNIKLVLNQDVEKVHNTKIIYLTPLAFMIELKAHIVNEIYQNEINIDMIHEIIQIKINEEYAKGSKAIKIFVHTIMKPNTIENVLEDIMSIKKTKELDDISALQTYIVYKAIEYASTYQMVVCIHTGVWTDVTKLSPKPIFKLVEVFPATTFDIYHLALPYYHECLFLAKNYPNAFLNLTWAHAVSKKMSYQAVELLLEMVPLNKIIAFGGDLMILPQHIDGALQYVKHEIISVLSKLIVNGTLTVDNTKIILRLWFYENPMKIYNLKEQNV